MTGQIIDSSEHCHFKKLEGQLRRLRLAFAAVLIGCGLAVCLGATGGYGVTRGSGLQIVDESGVVRASIVVEPIGTVLQIFDDKGTKKLGLGVDQISSYLELVGEDTTNTTVVRTTHAIGSSLNMNSSKSSIVLENKPTGAFADLLQDSARARTFVRGDSVHLGLRIGDTKQNAQLDVSQTGTILSLNNDLGSYPQVNIGSYKTSSGFFSTLKLTSEKDKAQLEAFLTESRPQIKYVDAEGKASYVQAEP